MALLMLLSKCSSLIFSEGVPEELWVSRGGSDGEVPWAEDALCILLEVHIPWKGLHRIYKDSFLVDNLSLIEPLLKVKAARLSVVHSLDWFPVVPVKVIY